jgi:hypothetical protein
MQAQNTTGLTRSQSSGLSKIYIAVEKCLKHERHKLRNLLPASISLRLEISTIPQLLPKPRSHYDVYFD